MKNDLRAAIVAITHERLRQSQAVTVSDILSVVKEDCREEIDSWGELLMHSGLVRYIKNILQTAAAPESRAQESQFALPGMEAPKVITNRLPGSTTEYSYTRFDLATAEQLAGYADILADNVASSIERQKDLKLKMNYLAPAFAHNPDFTVAEACQWLDGQASQQQPAGRPVRTQHDRRTESSQPAAV